MLKAHKQQANGKAWGAKLQKFRLVYLEMSSLPYLATSTDMTTYSDNQIGMD